MLKFSAEIWFK